MPDRAILYVTDNGETQQQLELCYAVCIEHGYEVISIATEMPGSADAWEAAHAMIRAGEADRIVVASGTNVPDLLESATGSIHGDRRPGQRRTRPLLRDEGA